MIKKTKMIDPPGILTHEDRTILFVQAPFYGSSWTISYGPGLLDWIFQSATRCLHFEPLTKEGTKFAEDIRRHLAA